MHVKNLFYKQKEKKDNPLLLQNLLIMKQTNHSLKKNYL